MLNGKKIIAIIPARSGSKGIKNKNIKKLNGKPLIAYSIEFAKSVGIIDYILVSTDSEKYAQIAKSYGAKVPFIRPSELAQDNSKGMDVIIHSLNWIKMNIDNAWYCLILQPTTPLRKVEDIEEMIKMFINNNADAIISVCEVDHPPEWTFKITNTLKLENIFNLDNPPQNRQDCQKYYRLNGVYYFAIIPFLLNNKSFFSKNTIAYIMPKIRSIDIDSELDFKLAEFLFKMEKEIL